MPHIDETLAQQHAELTEERDTTPAATPWGHKRMMTPQEAEAFANAAKSQTGLSLQPHTQEASPQMEASESEPVKKGLWAEWENCHYPE